MHNIYVLRHDFCRWSMLPWMLYNCIAEPSCAPRSTYALTPCRRDTQDGTFQKWLKFPCCSLWKLRKGHPFFWKLMEESKTMFFFHWISTRFVDCQCPASCEAFSHPRSHRECQDASDLTACQVAKNCEGIVFLRVWRCLAWICLVGCWFYIWDEILPHIFMVHYHSPVIMRIPSKHLTELYRRP